MYLYIHSFFHFHLIGLQVKLLGEGVVAMTHSPAQSPSSFVSLPSFSVSLGLCFDLCVISLFLSLPVSLTDSGSC